MSGIQPNLVGAIHESPVLQTQIDHSGRIVMRPYGFSDTFIKVLGGLGGFFKSPPAHPLTPISFPAVRGSLSGIPQS